MKIFPKVKMMSIQHTCSVMVQSIPNVLAEVWDMLQEGKETNDFGL